jgi:hypothetical protein
MPRGPVITMPQTHSAGTTDIARESGGDSLRVDEASAVENTLSRIRHSYALHFHLPEGVKPGQERAIEVALSATARKRYPDADVRYRRHYVTGSSTPEVLVSQRRSGSATPSSTTTGNTESATSDTPPLRRRPAVSEPIGPRAPMGRTSDNSTRSKGGWRRETDPEPRQENGQVEQKADNPPSQPAAEPNRGWRRVKPGEEP